MVSIKILVFASLRDKFQEQRELALELEQTKWDSANELRAYLLGKLQARWLERNQYNNHNDSLSKIRCSLPNVKPNTIMLAVNEDFIDPSVPINLYHNDRIALIPPVSGG